MVGRSEVRHGRNKFASIALPHRHSYGDNPRNVQRHGRIECEAIVKVREVLLAAYAVLVVQQARDKSMSSSKKDELASVDRAVRDVLLFTMEVLAVQEMSSGMKSTKSDS